jgi:serine/threonine-protein kinase
MVVASRYRLDRRFASGATGSLWHAHDELKAQSCTVRLADSGVVELRGVRERFMREVQAAEALRCENVVNVIDHGEWSGMPFIVFEALDGEDLATRLRRERRLPPGEVLEIVADVSHALTRAHDLGIVHRDLKPENIFLIRTGNNEVAKVLDFGVTGGGGGASLDRTTKVGPHLGLPLYTSPEQATAGAIDFRSDLWALAAIAYQCFAGRPPFETDGLDDLLNQLASAEVPKLHELDPSLPPALDEWRENALARDPELRFQSAEELADALAGAFQRSTLTGHPSPEWRSRGSRRPASGADSTGDLTWLAGVPDASASAADNFSEAPMSRQRADWSAGSNSRRRALRVSVGAVFLLMAGTLGVSLVRQNENRMTMAEVTVQRQKAAPRVARGPVETAAPDVLSAGPLPEAETAAKAPADAANALITPPPADPGPCTDTEATLPAREPARLSKPKSAAASTDLNRARATRKADARRELSTARPEPDYGI